jgi:hypothetical protein
VSKNWFVDSIKPSWKSARQTIVALILLFFLVLIGPPAAIELWHATHSPYTSFDGFRIEAPANYVLLPERSHFKTIPASGYASGWTEGPQLFRFRFVPSWSVIRFEASLISFHRAPNTVNLGKLPEALANEANRDRKQVPTIFEGSIGTEQMLCSKEKVDSDWSASCWHKSGFNADYLGRESGIEEFRTMLVNSRRN